MSSCFNPIGETGITICRDGDEYGSPVRLKVVSSDGAYNSSSTMTTQDIGKLASSLALIYFRRTGKVPMPPASTPFATVEFASDTVDENGASLPRCPKCGSQSGDDWSQCGGECPMPMSPHYAKPAKEASCAFCLDECTGECL